MLKRLIRGFVAGIVLWSICILIGAHAEEGNRHVKHTRPAVAEDVHTPVVHFAAGVEHGPEKKYLFVGEETPSALPTGYTPLFPISKNYLYGCIDQTGRLIIEPQFSFIQAASEGLTAVGISFVYDVKEDGAIVECGQCGYLGEDGKYAIPPQYKGARPFREGLAVVDVTPYGVGGYIDKSGRMVFNEKYGNPRDFSDGMAWVSTTPGGFAAINTKGEVVTKMPCNIAGTKHWWFKEGLAFIWEGQYDPMGRGPEQEKYFIDQTGKAALRVEGINDAAFFDQGRCFAKVDGQWGMIDKQGKWIAPPTYDQCFTYAKGFTELVRYDSRYVTTFLTKPSVSTPGHPIYTFAEGLALVVKNGKYGFIDEQGKEVITLQYTNASFFSEGLASVSKSDTRGRERYGAIDHHNHVVIPIQYEDALHFQEGLAAVKVQGRWGFIDRHGKMVIRQQFAEVGSFKYGLAPIFEGKRSYQKKWGYIDRTGKVVWKPSR